MSGEITIKERDWKAEIFMLALAFVVALVFASLVLPLFDLPPIASGALSGLAAYAAARVGYGRFRPGGAVRRIAWELTDAALVLDGRTIPRDAIRAAHCWRNRDAFGHTLPGLIVNIETGQRNALLRSADGGEELARLVHALGGQVPAD